MAGQRNIALNDDRFEVLNLVSIALPGTGQWWSTEDLEQPGARGAIFRCARADDGHELAYLLVVDVTDDPSEPDITTFSEGDAAGFDEFLRQAIPDLFARDGRRLVTWMASQLNERLGRFGSKGLVTAYVGWDQGRERQYIDCRTSVRGRRVVVGGCFDIEHKNEFAGPIFWAINDARPVDFSLQ
jgi:hypothetical protein